MSKNTYVIHRLNKGQNSPAQSQVPQFLVENFAVNGIISLKNIIFNAKLHSYDSHLYFCNVYKHCMVRGAVSLALLDKCGENINCILSAMMWSESKLQIA